jgi:cobalt transporter subunit CbtA
VSQFRRLMLVALVSGALAGLALFAIQYRFLVPRIEAAETYESAAHDHEEEGWKPSGGLERNLFTALSTVLTGIGFAALLFAAVSFSGQSIDARRGALWGLAGFFCFVLAPALGLPPQLPGVPVADLDARQLWLIFTAAVTAIGLFLLIGSRAWLPRIAGAAFLVAPHLIGAPVATGQNPVPVELIHQFAIASVAANGIFWLLLGTIGGLIWNKL